MLISAKVAALNELLFTRRRRRFPNEYARTWSGDARRSSTYCPHCQQLNVRTIRMHQERRYQRAVVGTDIKNPDFARYRLRFYSEQVANIEEFKTAFDNALNSKTGAVSI